MNELHELPPMHSSDHSAADTKTESESSNFVSKEKQDGGLKGWMSVAGWQVLSPHKLYFNTDFPYSWFILFSAMG